MIVFYQWKFKDLNYRRNKYFILTYKVDHKIPKGTINARNDPSSNFSLHLSSKIWRPNVQYLSQTLHSDLKLFLLFLKPKFIVWSGFTPNLETTLYLHLPRNPMLRQSSLELLRLILFQPKSLSQESFPNLVIEQTSHSTIANNSNEVTNSYP